MRFFALALLVTPMLASAKTEVSFLFSYDPDHPERPETRRILDLAGDDGGISPVKWGGLSLPGAGGRSTPVNTTIFFFFCSIVFHIFHKCTKK